MVVVGRELLLRVRGKIACGNMRSLLQVIQLSLNSKSRSVSSGKKGVCHLDKPKKFLACKIPRPPEESEVLFERRNIGLNLKLTYGF
jgi:hypothetical protein